MAELAPSQAFDGYRLERLLGKGGMGAVYLATDTLLERQVAVKFILTEEDETARQRFMVEARAIARLQHPNVVSVYRVGEVDGVPYLVSEYIQGTPLDKLDRPITHDHALKLSIGMACALSAAHRKGVLHRDIKPANAILSDDGEVKLLDFGIAKLMGQAVETAPRDTVSVDWDAATVPPEGAMVVDDNTVVVNSPVVAGTADMQLTADDMILGTPHFMAPEIWMGAPASFQSDIYAFGMLIYTLLSTESPHSGSNLMALRNSIVNNDAPPLLSVAPHVDSGFADIIDQCLKRAPSERFSTINEVRARLERLAGDERGAILPEGNPYRGLHAFEAEHQNLFFGRDSEIRLILNRLKSDPFVLVAGDSGVGKSSLCRAGVLPRIDRWLGGTRAFRAVQLVPGRYPVRALGAALASFTDQSEAALVDEIRTDPGGVARALRASQGDARGLVLFIDQLEELATVSDPDEAAEATAFLSWLLVPSEGIRLLTTARGDFLSRLAALPHIGDEISRALFFVRPLSAERIEEAVVGPARVMGVTFESQELISTLVDSTEQAGGALPLLQFALAELWESRDKHKAVISAAALARMGGVAGALSRHADSVIAAMLPEERAAARRVLLSLVTGENTRARRTFDEAGGASSAERRAVDALVRGRLLVARDTPEGAGVEIAHEALLRSWHTLAGWLSSNAEARAARERLRRAAAEWHRLGRKPELLWQRSQLREIHGVDTIGFGPDETAFVAASKAAVRRAVVRRAGLIVAVPLLAAFVYGVLQVRARSAVNARVAGEVAAAKAILIEIDGLTGETERLRDAAIALFDAKALETAEPAWGRYLERDALLLPLYRKVGQHLETALLFDPERADVREMFAQHLFDRAQAAEAHGAKQEAEELIARLALYDNDGRFLTLWRAPGAVRFDIEPAGARVALYRFVASSGGRSTEAAVKVRPDPSGRLVLPNGSYVATMDAPKRAVVRYPFVVGRGADLVIDVTLPQKRAIPEGFVYVPPGEFLFGSGASEGLRRDFFHAAPLHEVKTGGYLIAANETTFGQWLAYLDQLADPERSERLPRMEKGGFQGALSVTKDDAGRWRIAFQPTVSRYEASAGEPIRYGKRERLSEQDWLRFPVFGISVADAEAFAAWLHRTGRVPGARLCTDIEWERGARGSDGREYPHGHRLGKDDANIDATYGKVPESMGPDMVGSHPVSNSPFGLSDMAGNVWEWTRSSLENEAYAARGGSYLFGQNSARATDREVTESSFRDVSVGMRLCADLHAE